MVIRSRQEYAPNTSDKMADMVKLLTELGPDIDLIARKTGVFKETVRYWYKAKILGRGMAVQAVPNEAALGMKRVATKVRVAEMFLPHIQKTFLAMNDLSYATAFGLYVPEEYYVLHATVPGKFVADYGSFIMKLKDMGIFESAEMYEFDWFRRIPMRAEHYDFEASRWDYDWQSPLPVAREQVRPKQVGEAKFDKTDLLILKELQLDASRPLTQINRAIVAKSKVELNYKTMEWHYRRHVLKGGLIKGYSVRWPETKHNQPTEKIERQRHKYLVVDVVVRDVSHGEFLSLSAKMNRTPFLWSEMGGKDYLAQFAFPVEATMEALEYLRGVIRPFGGRASHYVVDQKNAAQFVLPYNLWSESEKEWKFERDNSLAHIENLVLRAKDGD